MGFDGSFLEWLVVLISYLPFLSFIVGNNETRNTAVRQLVSDNPLSESALKSAVSSAAAQQLFGTAFRPDSQFLTCRRSGTVHQIIDVQCTFRSLVQRRSSKTN